MDKFVLGFFLLVSLALLGAGIYLTMVAFKHTTPSEVILIPTKFEQFMIDHLKLMKVLSPIMIGLGAIGAILSMYALSKGMHQGHSSSSNFGFKFY